MMPAGNYKTYQILAPKNTHTRPATCEEVNCPDYLNGWAIGTTGLSEEDLAAINQSGRQGYPGELENIGPCLMFPPGQPCFRASTHTVTLEREPFYLTGRGDKRLYSPRTATNLTAEQWVDDFATNQSKLKDLEERG